MKTNDEHPERTEDFDAVVWTRRVRDALHREYAELSTRDFVRMLSKKGEQSAFGKKLGDKFQTIDPTTKTAA